MSDITTTTHIRLSEWLTLDPDTDAPLRGVYLNDLPAQSTAKALANAGTLYIENLRAGLRVRATSFVGRLRLGNLVITVHPKIDAIRLLAFLRYGYRLRNLRQFETTAYGIGIDTFPDLVIAQLIDEAENLIARGLPRAYVREAEDLVSPRGRIDMQRIARDGIVRDRLPSIHHPRRDDTYLNRVLLAGLQLAAHMTDIAGMKITLHRLVTTLSESVSGMRLDVGAVIRAQRALNRLTNVYQPALTLIRMLLEAKGAHLDDDNVVQLSGFLFDMNRLFQAVLSRFIAENLRGHTVQSEYQLRGMMAFHPQHNPWQSRAPSPRPDIAILQDGRVVTFLDAKYMDLWERRAIGRDVLYQLAIYALSQPWGGTSVILYPTSAPAAREARVEITEPRSRSTRAHVIARPVHIDTLYAHLSSGSTLEAERSRASYAKLLAFGAS